MVKVGIIGLGFIGKMHLGVVRKSGMAVVTAVADRVPANLTGNATAGNLAVEGDTNLEGVALYDDGDALLRDVNVDAVLIALPTYLHKPFVLKAMEAGKHILCEKPLALSGQEGREIAAAVDSYDKVFMVAQCIRFWPAYVKAEEYVRQQTYGRVLSAQFTRESGKPSWSWEGWLHDETRSGGGMLDLHNHDVDFVQHLFGMPDRIEAVGHGLPGEGIGQVHAHYRYTNGPVVALDGGWFHPSGFPFRMAFRMVFERAAIEYTTQTDGKLRVYTEDGQTHLPDILPGDGYTREWEYFLRCVAEGRKPELATADSAAKALELVDREREAILRG